jgi:hypothetical protein
MQVAYGFEEFLSHLRAMGTVKDYTEVRGSYSTDTHVLYVGTDRNDVADSMRVIDYFVQQDGGLSNRKASAFMGVAAWLVRHADSFITAGEARRAEDGNLELSTAALRASFEEFKANEWNNPELTAVVERAKVLRKELDP